MVCCRFFNHHYQHWFLVGVE